ncbi:MAG: hypothetical protein KY467_15935 [Gemmatimonadetes bacterium]|nr:hypothetical protein [Gemmatimonadota bacterium]
MNDVTSTVAWSPDGTCAWPAGTTASVGRSYEWLGWTGWSLGAYTWSYGYGCDKVYNGSTVHFVNGVFCAFLTTNTYYEPARVEGLADSRAAFFWSNRKDGTCAFMLSDNRRYGHGTP